MPRSDADVERSPSSEKEKHDHYEQQVSQDDAQMKWTFTRCVAIAALCMVYVGNVSLHCTSRPKD